MDQTQGLGRDVLSFLPLLQATPGSEAWGEWPLLLYSSSKKAGGFSLMALHCFILWSSLYCHSFIILDSSQEMGLSFPHWRPSVEAGADKLQCGSSLLPVISVALADNGEDE